MCCDGTLFAKASIKDESDRILAWQNRPTICSNYFCQPIMKLSRGKMSLHEVQEMISRALQLKQKFERVKQVFPEISGKSALQVRQLLYNNKHTPDVRADMKRQYLILYLIGSSLFPLLNEIGASKQKRKKAKERPPATR